MFTLLETAEMLDNLHYLATEKLTPLQDERAKAVIDEVIKNLKRVSLLENNAIAWKMEVFCQRKKLHRRNIQIKDLKAEVEDLNSQVTKLLANGARF